jgi:hypothetical protein
MGCTYSQGDMIWLNEDQLLPDGKSLNHPLIIVSNASSNSSENPCHYTAVMMSSSSVINDLFTFSLDKTMFEGFFDKEIAQIRTHLLISVNENQIKKKVNKLNKPHLKEVLRRIKETVLSLD